MEIFFENGMNFIRAQMEAGADGIQIVEPNCSLISPQFYKDYIMPLHTKMVEEIQKENGFARLHICGDTNKLLKYSLGTGTRILDVDSAVDLAAGKALLKPCQVFCGNLDSVSDVLGGAPDAFAGKVKAVQQASGDRAIIAAGCDIPPATSVENMIAFHDAVEALKYA